MWLLPRARGWSGAPPKPPVHRQNQALEEHKEQSKVEHRNRQARQEEGALSLSLLAALSTHLARTQDAKHWHPLLFP